MYVRDPRLIDVDPDHQRLLAELVDKHGIVRAIEMTGLGRVAILGVLGRGSAMAGTCSLLREFVRRREAA